MSKILKIQSTDPRNPQPTLVTLKFNQPKEVEGNYGTQYMYGVIHEGMDKTIYATPGMHRRIQEIGARQGDTLSIIRTGEGKETRWDIIVDGRDGTKQIGRDGDPFVVGPYAKQELKSPTFRPEAEFQRRMAQYGVAWEMAHEFISQRGGEGDLNAVAFTFYKMAQDCGHDLTAPQEADEAPFDLPGTP